MADVRGISDDDVRWMRRDLVSSLLGVQWFSEPGGAGPDAAARMAAAVVRALGWTDDRTDEAARLLRSAIQDVGPTAGWGRLVDRIVELAEDVGPDVIDADHP